MKIFIPFKPQKTGGPSSFVNKFKEGLKQRGFDVFFDFKKDYDILFVVVQCNPIYLLHAKINRKKIIHRLDGVFYWSIVKWKYPLLNFPPKIVHKFFSNFTVYQSKYSKYCADKFLGKKNAESTIIYNGVDLKKFSPKGPKIENLRDNKEQYIFFTASKFRREDQIIPILKSLKIYRDKYNSNFKFLIAGDFSKKLKHIPKKYSNFAQIKFLGIIKNANLPKYQRSSDIFLITHLNPPCPNNVIEAMACGLPICGIDDGAMKELTQPGKNSLLISTTGDAFWKKRTYNLEKFAENIDLISRDLNKYSRNSIKISRKKLSLDKMIEMYIEVFNKSKTNEI